MKEFRDLPANDIQISHQTALITKESTDIQIQNITTHHFSYSEDVDIERFCRMVSCGVNIPFPRSQQQLSYAVIGIKNALQKISLIELIQRKPYVVKLSSENVRTTIKPIKSLDVLLKKDMIKQAFPNLWQAVRFMHEKDQQEIYEILCFKLHCK